MKDDKKKDKVSIVYGGPCYTNDSKKGFIIFVKKGSKYERMCFGQKSTRLWDKVIGGIYKITEITPTGAKFGSFAPTGEMCEDKEVLQQIMENELDYGSASKEKSFTAAMKKHEKSIENLSLGELKKMAHKNYSFGRAVKNWVNSNF